MAPEIVLTIALFGCAAGLSLLQGAKPEQCGGLLLVLWLLFERSYHLTGAGNVFARVDPVIATLDVIVLIALLLLALLANRLWPIVAASAQTVTVLGHLVPFVMPTPGMQRAYWAMTQVPPLLVAFAVLGGTLAHIVRIRRLGHYRDWRRRHRFV
jgi:hypothetical protein